MTFAKVLVVFAHPDDAEFMCGGTVAAWTAEGSEVHYVVVTDGSGGSNDPEMTRERLAVIRAAEQRAAAGTLGVASVTFLGFTDGYLECNLDLRRAVAREVRRFRPDVLMGPDPARLWTKGVYINHPDHKAVGEALLCAVMPDAPSRPQFPELLEEGFEPFAVPNLWLAGSEADDYVDITGTMDRKLEALTCHASQNDGESFKEWVRARAASYGERGGFTYAEAFRTFAFGE
jgi:LmbE family N-acetylglucosaminyl deacetylase